MDSGAAATEVRHEPPAPKSDVPVLVTARLAKGVTKPVLKLQAVEPGKYVGKSARVREGVDRPTRPGWFPCSSYVTRSFVILPHRVGKSRHHR